MTSRAEGAVVFLARTSLTWLERGQVLVGEDELWRGCFCCLYFSSTSKGGKERMVNMYVCRQE
jgi:hypothetical protein